LRRLILAIGLFALVAAPAGAVAKRHAAPSRGADDGSYVNYLTRPDGTKTPLLDYPGSATVVTRKMMDDMQARSVCGAMSVAAGVSVGGCR
jgi:outer membrane receptor for ferric coprogen and ferric-rhodotorulic acid